MKSILPVADVGFFETSGESDELKHVNFQKEYGPEDKIPDFETSYLAGCSGDSGSGHWITIDKEQAEPWKHNELNDFPFLSAKLRQSRDVNVKMSQRALVTIYTHGHGILIKSDATYDFKNLPFESFSCGTDVTLDDGTRVVEAQFGTRTTNEQILQFLKLHAEISNIQS